MLLLLGLLQTFCRAQSYDARSFEGLTFKGRPKVLFIKTAIPVCICCPEDGLEVLQPLQQTDASSVQGFVVLHRADHLRCCHITAFPPLLLHSDGAATEPVIASDSL
jgi:hypothetical protein